MTMTTTYKDIDPLSHPVFDRLPPIFREVAGPDQGRFRLSYPFLENGRVHATDGKIVASVPVTPEVLSLLPKPPDGMRFPKADSVYGWWTSFRAEPVSVPSLDGLGTCPQCDGSGQRPIATCPACLGTGEDQCPECDEDLECLRCEGRGRIPAGGCLRCDATGIGDLWDSVQVGEGIRLAGRYLALLKRHGAVLYLPTQTPDADNRIPVRFTIGEIEGRLMPIVDNDKAAKAAKEKVQP